MRGLNSLDAFWYCCYHTVVGLLPVARLLVHMADHLLQLVPCIVAYQWHQLDLVLDAGFFLTSQSDIRLLSDVLTPSTTIINILETRFNRLNTMHSKHFHQTAATTTTTNSPSN